MEFLEFLIAKTLGPHEDAAADDLVNLECDLHGIRAEVPDEGGGDNTAVGSLALLDLNPSVVAALGDAEVDCPAVHGDIPGPDTQAEADLMALEQGVRAHTPQAVRLKKRKRKRNRFEDISIISYFLDKDRCS